MLLCVMPLYLLRLKRIHDAYLRGSDEFNLILLDSPSKATGRFLNRLLNESMSNIRLKDIFDQYCKFGGNMAAGLRRSLEPMIGRKRLCVVVEDLLEDFFMGNEMHSIDTNEAMINEIYRWIRNWTDDSNQKPFVIIISSNNKRPKWLMDWCDAVISLPETLDDADRIWIVSQLKPNWSLELVKNISRWSPVKNFSSLQQTIIDIDLMLEGCLEMTEIERLIKASFGSELLELSRTDDQITWESIFGLEEAKLALQETSKVLFNEDFRLAHKKLGVLPVRGVLLFGPPGTGKTMLAKALATTCHATFISLSIHELVHAQIGESERSIREAFKKALASEPAVLFIDEIDAIFQKDKPSSSSGRLLGALISQFDQLSQDPEANIFVLAATNFIDRLDESLLGFGRFERQIECRPSDNHIISLQLSLLSSELMKLPTKFLDDSLTDDSLKNIDPKLLEGLKSFSGAEVRQIVDFIKMGSLKRALKTMQEPKISLDDVIDSLRLKRNSGLCESGIR